MKPKWALQDAKNRLSEVVDTAIARGPQAITRRGKDAAVLLSMEDFRRLTGATGDLVSFLRGSPLATDLQLDRDPDTGREIEL